MPQISLVYDTYDVVASPDDDAEIVIATLNQVSTINPFSLVHIHAWAFLEVDADATGAILTVRRGTLAGDPVGSGSAGPTFDAAAFGDLGVTLDVQDAPGDLASATYVLTLAMADAGGATAVAAVHLEARV